MMWTILSKTMDMESNDLDEEIREVLQKNPVAFYVNLLGADYGPISKTYVKMFVERQKLKRIGKEFDEKEKGIR